MAHDSHGHAETVEGHAMGEVHEHPTWKQYKWVALILTLITVVEVWCYYIPSFVASPAFVPVLLIMSAVKFAIVVLFYMHLKYDHKLFRWVFVTGIVLATIVYLIVLNIFHVFRH
jgi:cytochrome c oxidase subunit 4